MGELFNNIDPMTFGSAALVVRFACTSGHLLVQLTDNCKRICYRMLPVFARRCTVFDSDGRAAKLKAVTVRLSKFHGLSNEQHLLFRVRRNSRGDWQSSGDGG